MNENDEDKDASEEEENLTEIIRNIDEDVTKEKHNAAEIITFLKIFKFSTVVKSTRSIKRIVDESS